MNPNNLLQEIQVLQSNGIGKQVLSRYAEFKAFEKKSEKDWFSELCFCLLTANTSSEMGIRMQNSLGFEGFYELPEKKLAKRLRELKYRFYNRRAEFIVKARKHFGVKEKVKEFENEREARDYLQKNVTGLGFKEASHFLRNTGSDNVAILDRHVIKIMNEYKLIPEPPKYVNASNYLKLESRLDNFAEKTGLNHSQLDLYLWYMKTGKVLK